jgi:hypothetical protein
MCMRICIYMYIITVCINRNSYTFNHIHKAITTHAFCSNSYKINCITIQRIIIIHIKFYGNSKIYTINGYPYLHGFVRRSNHMISLSKRQFLFISFSFCLGNGCGRFRERSVYHHTCYNDDDVYLNKFTTRQWITKSTLYKSYVNLGTQLKWYD